MTAFRPATTADLPAIWELLDCVFPDESGMHAAFPIFLGEANAHNLYIATRGGDIIAHIGTNRRRIMSNDATLEVACIGAVAVHSDHRGAGLASDLLNWSYTRLLVERLHLALISGDGPLYIRSGAVPYGMLQPLTIDFDPSKPSPTDHRDLRAANLSDALSECQSLYDTRPIRYIRTAEDWKAFELSAWTYKGPGSLWMWNDMEGNAAGYAIAADRAGKRAIVEWAGDSATTRSALYELAANAPSQRLTMDVAHYDDRFAGTVNLPWKHETLRPYLGTVRIIDAPGLCDAIGIDYEADEDMRDLAVRLFSAAEATPPKVALPPYGLDFV